MERTSKKIKKEPDVDLTIDGKKLANVLQKEEPIIEAVVVPMLRWQKIGGGSLRWGNRIIKPGEVFEANLEDLPKAFMDTLVCLDKEGLKKAEIAVKKETLVIENLFKLVKSKVSKSHWDVVGDNGKPINESPLEKGSAEELLLALNG